MESNLRILLDKIYELEGLVHLALKRDDASEDFLRLISDKGMQIGEITKGLTEQVSHDTVIPEIVNPVFSLDEYSIDEEEFREGGNEIISQPTEKEDDNLSPLFQKMTTSEDQRGKLVFSINERFRFRKELFDNSDADFNNTLALVASMEDYEEAEDYFINEEGFDKNNKAVRDFLEVLKKYFK